MSATLTLILLTYEPGGETPRGTAERVLTAFLDRARYDGPINVHIADDGSVEGHVDGLRAIAGGYDTVGTIGATNAGRRGYGHSYNLATQAVHAGRAPTDVCVVLEDDWLLTRELVLDPLVATLEQRLANCIRLGYLGFTQAMWGVFVHTPAGPMIELDQDSEEPHVAAGHARIETIAYERQVGPWAEGLAPGATEFDWARRRAARIGVAWPLNYGPASQRADSLFVHIGTVDLGELEPSG